MTHRLDEPDRVIPWPVALPQSRPPFRPATVTLRDGRFVIQLSSLPALVAGLGELAVALGVDLALAAFEHVQGRNVADGRMQACGVVVLDVFTHPTFGFFHGTRALLTARVK